MATSSTDPLRFLFLSLLLGISTVAATPVRAKDFTEAMKAPRCPVIVYVHGSSWHRASRMFYDQIWSSGDFTSQLRHDAILTDIHIRQNLSEEAAKQDAATRKGWDDKPIRTYPTLQVYAADGFLLKTIQGGDVREITSPAALATNLDAVLESAKRRSELLAEIAAGGGTAKLTELIELPINLDPALIGKLKQADPSDSSGWQARLSFKDWGFIREVTKLIDDKKPDEALAVADKLLESTRFDPGQHSLILGARGMALVAKGDLTAAWETFNKAHAADPKGANGTAVWRYGIRTAGIPLRVILPPDSILSGKDIGENISRDHATYTQSSTINDSAAKPETLFSGAPSASGFAFHTNQEKGAHIIIDLKASCEIRALRITNRLSYIQRAESLTLWTSDDGTRWTKAWAAGKAEPAWDILFAKPVQARYLKLGLTPDRADFLHLQTVDIYGKPGK